MTTRQFLSILLSCLLFLHPLSFGQWIGTGLVFGALYYKVFSSVSFFVLSYQVCIVL